MYFYPPIHNISSLWMDYSPAGQRQFYRPWSQSRPLLAPQSWRLQSEISRLNRSSPPLKSFPSKWQASSSRATECNTPSPYSETQKRTFHLPPSQPAPQCRPAAQIGSQYHRSVSAEFRPGPKRNHFDALGIWISSILSQSNKL
jgi:hypothetical protein